MNEHLNLIPKTELTRARVRQSINFWLLAAFVTAIGLVAMSLNHRRVLNLTTQRLDALEREFEPVRNLQALLVQYRTRLEEIDRIRSQTYDVDQRRPMITLMAALSRATADAEQRITISELDLQSYPSPDPMSVNPCYRLVIQGIGIDNSSVAEFASSLQQSKLFSSVDLHETTSTRLYGLEVRQFELECTF